MTRRRLTRRRFPSLSVALLRMIVLWVTAVLLCASCITSAALEQETEEYVPAVATALTVDGSAIIGAGDALEITVTAEEPDGTVIRIAALGTVGTEYRSVVLIDGMARVSFGPPLTQHAGTIVVLAGSGEHHVRHEVQVLPGTASDPLVPLVGPRTIVADGQDFTLAVTTPVDRWGNAVADGTIVDYEVVRQDGDAASEEATVRNGIAAMRVESRTITGRTAISAESGAATGPTLVIDEVAGAANDFRLDASPAVFIADGLTTYRLETTQLKDIYGNTLPDGVVVEVTLAAPEGVGVITTTVQNGRAVVSLPAPTAPGTLTAVPRVSGVDGQPAVIEFAPAVTAAPVTISARTGTTEFRIGPVVAPSGGWLPDGTTVSIRRNADETVVAMGQLDDGVATVNVDPSVNPGDLVIEILGVTFEGGS